MRPLQALTLHPEWAWAIAYLPEEIAKRVENRTWLPDARVQAGDWLAIHAGALSLSRNGATWRRRLFDVCSASPVALGIRVPRRSEHTGFQLLYDGQPIREATSAIVAVARVASFDQEQRTAWDVQGQYHWRLEDVQTLALPVACRGRQGLWRLPEDVFRLVRPQVTM